MLQHEPDIKGTNLHEVIRAQIELGKLKSQLPSVSSVRRWLAKANTEYGLALHKMRNPDDFKNRKQVAWGMPGKCDSD